MITWWTQVSCSLSLKLPYKFVSKKAVLSTVRETRGREHCVTDTVLDTEKASEEESLSISFERYYLWVDWQFGSDCTL